MAVKLDKLYQDCSHPDPQIQTYALMTVTRLSPQLADQPDQIQRILDKLKSLMQSQNPDVVFLARKAVNHLEIQFKDYIKREAAPPPPPPPPIAAGPVIEPIGLEGMMNLDGPVAFPAGAAPLIDLEELNKPAPEPERPPPPPPPPAPPVQVPARELVREQILSLLTTTTDAIYLASLVMELKFKGKPEDIPQLVGFLKHADDRVRANTVEVFQAHATREHIEHVVPLLDDRANRAVGNACMALAKHDHPLVPRKLLAMLRSNHISMRETAAFVLTTLEKDYAEPLLVLAARDPYEGVRIRAIKRLAHWLTRDSVNALKNALNDMDIDVCEAASESLRQIKATLQARKQAEEEAARAAALAAAAPKPPPPPAPAPEPPPPPPPAPAPAPAPAPSPVATAPAPRQIATPKPASIPVVPPPAPPPPPPPPPAPEPELTPSAAAVHPEEATPVVPQATAPRSQEGDLLSNAYRELGEQVYGLCRNNYITNELLDGLFYEILRYQDFLRAYQSKQSKLEDASQKAAIEKLEEKIRTAMIGLGRQAASLFNNAQVPIPEKERPQIQGILDRVKKARRATTGH